MSKPPTFYQQFAAAHPDVVRAYEALGDAARAAGPLDAVHAELVKLALAAGARLEGGVHAHARRALDAGATPEQLRHVAVLGITTLGFPAAMSVRGMIEDVLAARGRA
uniref:Carboxymuconolactone decarboxylase family protein n=1 Tax=Eiseniibacteriota bacterium TaxID=2212470 RepID=A0A832I2D0_UNCEI